jgi:hypothetical protein
MANDIHTLLKKCDNLNNNQRLDYCNSERYYMKQYLKYTLLKVNKCVPD